MKTHNVIRPQRDTIRILDAIGNLTEVKLVNLKACLLEPFILGVQLPQNIVLGDDAESRSEVRRMAKSGVIFKIIE